MQQHPTHKNAKGFTLIELVIAVAIIGILTSVAVLGYNQYKVRAYDAHSKQALRDILLQCNAFWLDHDASQVCTHATVAEVYVASDEIVLKFPAEDRPDLPDLPGSHGNFCASAQHVSSPNTYSIDSASLISSGSNCSGAGGSVQTASVSENTTCTVRVPGWYSTGTCSLRPTDTRRGSWSGESFGCGPDTTYYHVKRWYTFAEWEEKDKQFGDRHCCGNIGMTVKNCHCCPRAEPDVPCGQPRKSTCESSEFSPHLWKTEAGLKRLCATAPDHEYCQS